MLSNLAGLIKDATDALDEFEYGRAIDLVEREFWGFCDDYLEFVKGRRYGEQGPEAAGSANSALVAALSVYLRLFAPYLPFATEEVWSWWKEGSVHRAAWPSDNELTALMRGVSDDDRAEMDLRARGARRSTQAAVRGQTAVESADRSRRDRGHCRAAGPSRRDRG